MHMQHMRISMGIMALIFFMWTFSFPQALQKSYHTPWLMSTPFGVFLLFFW